MENLRIQIPKPHCNIFELLIINLLKIACSNSNSPLNHRIIEVLGLEGASKIIQLPSPTWSRDTYQIRFLRSPIQSSLRSLMDTCPQDSIILEDLFGLRFFFCYKLTCASCVKTSSINWPKYWATVVSVSLTQDFMDFSISSSSVCKHLKRKRWERD